MPEHNATESDESRAARAEACRKAESRRRRLGYAFCLPQWYRIPRVLERRGELLGSLQAVYRTCSGEGCPCQIGAKVHGPYWYRHWRDEEGRQHKTYVRREDLERVRRAIERRRARVELERERRKEHMRRGAYSWAAAGGKHPLAPPGAARGEAQNVTQST